MAIDIETAPALVYAWGLHDQNIGVDQVVDAGGMICFAAKWLGESEIEFRSTHHDGRRKMVRRLWKLLDEADAVLHFNGKRFDIPHIQRSFVEAGLTPPSPYKQIDLYLVVRRQFRFLSNKLAHVSPQLGLGGKVHHEGFRLWLRCMNRDKAAWARMRKYNMQDTALLEDAYEILRPWIPNHPSHAAERGADVCPKCGSGELQWRGFATTAVGRYRRFQCQSCGGWGRDTKRDGGTAVTQIAA